jgi:Ca2+-binding EF-hand superfamily protein
MPGSAKTLGKVLDPHEARDAYCQKDRVSQKWLGLGFKPGTTDTPRGLPIIPYDHPHYEPHHHLRVEDIERLVREKISSNTRNDSVVKKEAWYAFSRAGGSDRRGLTIEQVHRRLQQWSIRPTDKVLKECFAKWDQDNSGLVDFDEFFNIVMPNDFSSQKTLMHDLAKGFLQKERATMQEIFLANIGARGSRRDSLGTMNKKLDAASVEKMRSGFMTTPEIVEIIRTKVSAHSTGGNREMTDSYGFFGRPRLGISKEDFKQKLNLWSIFVTPEQLDNIFAQIDTDGNGKISFNEFLAFFGSENNYHPLYADKSAVGGVNDRRLSFLPGRKAKPGSGMTKTKPEQLVNASGKPLNAITRSKINSARRKNKERRLREPSYRLDRNGMLDSTGHGSSLRRTEVTAFLTRLLQNAHAQLVARGLQGQCDALEFVQEALGGRTKMPIKAFKKLVQQDLAGPLRMQPHTLNPAIHFYTSGLQSKDVDSGQLMRDLRELARTTGVLDGLDGRSRKYSLRRRKETKSRIVKRPGTTRSVALPALSSPLKQSQSAPIPSQRVQTAAALLSRREASQAQKQAPQVQLGEVHSRALQAQKRALEAQLGEVETRTLMEQKRALQAELEKVELTLSRRRK